MDAPAPNQAIIKQNRQLSVTDLAVVPDLIETAGARAKRRFVEYFMAEIENDHTRKAYFEAVDRFLHWAASSGLTLETLEPVLVQAYFKQNCPETRKYKVHPLSGELTTKPRIKSASSKKQHLAAVRKMFDHLTASGVIEYNPASSVKGPKLVVETGKTPVLADEDAARLLDAINLEKISGLRDRALIGCMLYAFARVGAVLAMDVDHVYENGRTLWLRLQEKGGKQHAMPAHHKLATFLVEYIDAAGIADQKGTPLFRSLDRHRQLTDRRLEPQAAYDVWKRRARQAGITSEVCNHTGRATGLTNFVRNGGSIETARMMANHSSSKVTRMYVRVDDELKQEEVERVRF